MLDDRNYDGPRWRYTSLYRPLVVNWWPQEWQHKVIIGSQRPNSLYPFGTFDVAAELPESLVSEQQLQALGRVYSPAEQIANVRNSLDALRRAKRHMGRTEATRQAESQLAELITRQRAGDLPELHGDLPL